MKPEVEYLLQQSMPSVEFDGLKFVQEIIFHELEQIRQASIYSSFQRDVVNHGYPVSQQGLSQSSYVSRQALENDVRNSILRSANIYIVGCEGSGKSTLVHYSISRFYDDYNSMFAYVDTSDIAGFPEQVSDVFYDKLRNALFLCLNKEVRTQFQEWKKQYDGDDFVKSVINTNSPKSFVVSILVFLNTLATINNIYIIVDNIDSLAGAAVETLFSAVHLVDEDMSAAFNAAGLVNKDRVRFIVSCRTQSLNVVTSASHGLFTKNTFHSINMDERFPGATDLIALTRRFITQEREFIFKKNPMQKQVIVATPAAWETFEEYCDDVFEFLSKSKSAVNSSISKFCGRSIRRSKLFILKALANPNIARLAFFERQKTVNFSRDRPEYIQKRLIEALFDFSTAALLQLPGYPLNPFAVLNDERQFRDNPLIGVVTMFYISERFDQIRLPDVSFANCISISSLIDYLQGLRYEKSAIIECIHSLVLSGLLRPVKSGSVILQEEGDFKKIYDCYIIDDQAFKWYIDLLLFKRWGPSLAFYNSALRYRYHIRPDRHIDNTNYEIYTLLVFVSDLIDREQSLEQHIADTGIMVRPLSARIKHIIFSTIRDKIEHSDRNHAMRSINNPRILRESIEMSQRIREIVDDLRYKLSRHAGIM